MMILAVCTIFACMGSAIADDTTPEWTVPTKPLNNILKRHTEKSGFHRDLVTEVSVHVSHLTDPSSCSMVLVENVPSGIYLDLYQVIGQVRWGGPQVLAHQDFDIEKPEDLSEPQRVYVYSGLKYTKGTLHAMVRLPIHLRYHKPSRNKSHEVVTLPTPEVLIKCSDYKILQFLGHREEAPCDHKNEFQCIWTNIDFPEVPEKLHFEVPVGQEVHQSLVVWGTLIVTVVATLILCFVILTTSNHDKVD